MNGITDGAQIFTSEGSSFGNGRAGVVGSGGPSHAIKINPLGSAFGSAGVVGSAYDNNGGGRHDVGVYGYTLYDAVGVNSSDSPIGGLFMTETTSTNTAFNGTAYGVYASSDLSAATSLGAASVYGVYGRAVGKTNATVYGGYFTATSGTTNFGVYSAAGTNYFNGNVGIGTATPTTFKLEVAGSIGPEADNTRDLGSSGRRFANVYGTTINSTNVNISSLTQGSMLFAGASGAISQDNANLFFDDTNNTVGVGTTRTGAISGVNARSVVKGSGATSTTSSFEVQDSAGASKFFVRDDGNVGVGTAGPSTKLSVIDNTIGITNVYMNIGPSTIDGSSRAGGIQLHASDGAGDRTWGILNTNSTPGSLRFEYLGARATAFGSGITTLTLGATGNVGIGTTAPTSLLHVLGSQPAAVATAGTAATQALQITGGKGGNTTGITGQTAGVGAGANITAGAGGDAPAGSINGNGGSITIQGGAAGAGLGTAGSYGNVLLATTGGNVGIGTTAPDNKLQINIATAGGAFGAVANLGLVNSNQVAGDYNGIQFRIGGIGSFNQAFIGSILTSVAGNGLSDLVFGTKALATDTAITEYMRIKSGGNVGIGTTTPGGILDILGPTTSQGVNIRAGGASGYYPFRVTHAGSSAINGSYFAIDNNGNVGIGTTDPSLAKLVVYDAAAGYRQRWTSPNATGYVYMFNNAAGATAAGMEMGVLTNHRLDFVTNSLNRMTIQGDGNVGIGTTSPLGKLHVGGGTDANIYQYIQSDSRTWLTGLGQSGGDDNYIIQDVTAGITRFRADTSGNVYIGGNAAASAGTMSVLNTGNVGIGTTTPVTKLDVYAGASGAGYGTNAKMAIESNGNAFLQFATPNTAISGIYFGDPQQSTQGGIFYDHASDYLRFDAGATNRMVVNSSGNVGIATSSPSYKLSVSGSAFFDGGTIYTSTLVATSSITTPLLNLTNLLVNGSTTLQNFTFQNATGTLLSLFGTNTDGVRRFSASSTAGPTMDWIVGVDLSDSGKFKIFSSTALGTNDRFVIDGNGVVSMGNLLVNGLQLFRPSQELIT